MKKSNIISGLLLTVGGAVLIVCYLRTMSNWLLIKYGEYFRTNAPGNEDRWMAICIVGVTLLILSCFLLVKFMPIYNKPNEDNQPNKDNQSGVDKYDHPDEIIDEALKQLGDRNIDSYFKLLDDIPKSVQKNYQYSELRERCIDTTKPSRLLIQQLDIFASSLKNTVNSVKKESN